MSNKIYIGQTKEVVLPDKGGFLLIDDEVPEVSRSRIFDPMVHCFDPLKGITYKKARELVDVLYAIFPQGENTLTVRNGKRELLRCFLEGKRLDKIRASDEASGVVNDLLMSPVLRLMLCSPTNFSFNVNSVILARVNRVELGEFDALVIAQFLIGHYKGQLVIPDFGFYGRNGHTGLLRENRLIAGCNFLDELPERLRQHVLLQKDKVASGTIFEDAEVLARYAQLLPGTNAYNEFVEGLVR